MTPQQVVGLGVRLFAIWLALVGLPYVIYVPFALARQHVDAGTMWSYLTGTTFFIVAILLWIFPMVVAHRLLPKTTFDNALTASTSEVAKVMLLAWTVAIDKVWTRTCFVLVSRVSGCRRGSTF